MDTDYAIPVVEEVAVFSAGRLPNSAVREYILAGNATLTFANAETGNRFTFKITKPRAAEERCPHFVKVLTGSYNEGDYEYIGHINAGTTYTHGRKSRIGADAQSARTFRWIWDHVDSLPENIEVWHEGKCLRCGRKLTVPESIESGYGPECIKHV